MSIAAPDPAIDGELVARPAFTEWAAMARANHEASAMWQFRVAGIGAVELRALARREALAAAAGFSTRLGVAVREPGDPDGLIVAGGHQPELYHPGVWIKAFLLQRLANDTGATALDLVVDTDGFEAVGFAAPCMSPQVSRCQSRLAVAEQDACFAGTPVPDAARLAEFCSEGDRMLATLPDPGIREHFSAFCEVLTGAREDAGNLAELITFARRRYEATAGTDYLELPLTVVGRTSAWTSFVVDIALSAERFADAYNSSLTDFRVATNARSAAQPFPDLVRDGGVTELPLWRIVDGRRSTLSVRPLDGGGAELLGADGACIVELPADPVAAAHALDESAELIAPKALALTLFVRTFVTDLMIHGLGGERYDRVTDDVCRRYYGVEPLPSAVASITMRLPLGMELVTEEEVSSAKGRLNRLEHNPDAMLGEVEFDSDAERARAETLAAEKGDLVRKIAEPDADKKLLGTRIREINAELAEVLAPLRERLGEELARLEHGLAVSDVLTDRTYPFCFWSPNDVAARAR